MQCKIDLLFFFFFVILGCSDCASVFACDSDTPTNLELDGSQSMKEVHSFMEWRKSQLREIWLNY